jgi:hypothetical protein
MNIEKESKLHKTTRDFIRSLFTYDKMVKLGTPGILLRGYWLDVKKQMHNFKTREEFKTVPLTFRQIYADHYLLIMLFNPFKNRRGLK